MAAEPIAKLDGLRTRLASLATLLSTNGAQPPPPAVCGQPAPDANITVCVVNTRHPTTSPPRTSTALHAPAPSKPNFKTGLAVPQALRAMPLRHSNHSDAHTVAAALSRLHDAEQGWARERGRLNLELQHAQRKAHKAEAEQRRCQEQLSFRVGEVKHLKAALGQRDVRLAELSDRVRQLEAADTTCQVSEQAVQAAQAERDELREALASMLARLEETQGLLQQTDAQFNSMAQQLVQAQAERQAALEEAAQAREEAANAMSSAQDLNWRVGLLQQLSDLTLRRNEEQASTLRALLESEALLEDTEGGLNNG